MSNIVYLAARKRNLQATTDVETTDFDLNIEQNERKKQRLCRERAESNKKVMREISKQKRW